MKFRIHVIGLVIGSLLVPKAACPADEHSKVRRPVALAFSDDERLLYVGNRESGTISVVQPASRKVHVEQTVGKLLSDLVITSRNQFLVTDEAEHQLIVCSAKAETVQVDHRIDVSPYPVGVVADASGKYAYVASLWSHRLDRISLDDDGPARQFINLPFAPRKLLVIEEQKKLVVADSFGGQMAVVDLGRFRLEFVREFPGHNIRGLALSPDRQRILVAHQMLNSYSTTVSNDIHWGLLVNNQLRWLSVDTLLDPKAELDQGANVHALDVPGHGAADPSGFVVTRDGTFLVAAAGRNELTLGHEKDIALARIQVGRRPTAMVLNRDEQRAIVTNMFDDSLSIVDLPNSIVVAEIPLGEPAELSIVQQGEVLFHDGRIAMEGWMSCHTCHTDGHSNGLLNDNFSDNSFGTPKRVLSLLGVVDTAPHSWLGEVKLNDQIRRSITVTMKSRRPVVSEQVDALAAYIQSLCPPPSVDALRGTADDEAIHRGGQLFRDSGCTKCHAPPFYTTPRSYDAGLEDSLGNKKFNPPSLRGLSQRGSFFHDNRATQLEEVFRTHGHQLDRDLSQEELADLVAFLRSL